MRLIKSSFFQTILILCVSFWLTSAGHMAWLYHLMTLTTAETSQQLATVGGYAAQAAGVGLFALLRRKTAPRLLYRVTVPAYTALMAPSVLGGLPVAAVFGLLMSLLCGVTAADLDGDGVSVSDATLLQQYLADFETDVPIGSVVVISVN